MKIIKNLYNSRELIWRLFLRDFNAKYRQSLIGWGWIFLLPMAGVGTFLLLGNAGTIKIENLPVPYPLWALVGFSLWQIFSVGLAGATASILSSGSFVAKINFAREALVISSIGQAFIEFWVKLFLVLIIYFIYGLLPSIWILISPFLILPLILITLGLGFITSLLNTVIRDMQNIINILMSFFLFFMPIMYTVRQESLIYRLNQYNPIYYLIVVPREIIMNGRFDNFIQYLISSLLAIFIFYFGWIVFDKAQPKLAEVV